MRVSLKRLVYCIVCFFCGIVIFTTRIQNEQMSQINTQTAKFMHISGQDDISLEHFNQHETNKNVNIIINTFKPSITKLDDNLKFSKHLYTLFPVNDRSIAYPGLDQQRRNSLSHKTYQDSFASNYLNRIQLQTYLKPKAVNKNKLILLYYIEKSSMNRFFEAKKCPINKCRFTKKPEDYENADAVIFKDVPKYLKRPAEKVNQLWIYHQLESPLHTKTLPSNALINWTATYRMDSILPTPYGLFKQFPIRDQDNRRREKEKRLRKLIGRKTKLIAWFVSNCRDKNGRLAYVRELQKYLKIDIYGTCGTMECKKFNNSCLEKLRHEYKFYLAFENSNCKDYITEKFFNALRYDVVPIVMGARKSEYEKLAPENSFIHVDDFHGPKKLAEYLNVLNKNTALYFEYMKWKSKGDFFDTTFQCRLCSMLHLADGFPLWYKNIDSWWNEGTCMLPAKNWTKWKDYT